MVNNKTNSEKEWYVAQIARAAKTLETMEIRLDNVIEDRNLNVPVKEIFANYNPFQMETVAVEILGLFQRHSLLLVLYDSMIDWGLNRFPELLSVDEKAEANRLKTSVNRSRTKYIDQFGRAIVRAFHERLLVESRTTVKINDLESLLIRFFGSAYPNQEDATGRTRLLNLIYNVGERVYRPQEAATVMDMLKVLPINNSSAAPTDEKDKEAFEKVLTATDVKLAHLTKTLDRLIDEKGLTEPEGTLFRKYRYSTVESIIIPVQYHFSRASLLLSCYEAELKFAALQHNLSKLPTAVKKRYTGVLDRMTEIRNRYVDTVGATVFRGLLRHLQVKGSQNNQDINTIDNLLIMWFGVGMPSPGDYDCPAFHELEDLLDVVGVLTGHPEETTILVRCLQTTARLEKKPPIR